MVAAAASLSRFFSQVEFDCYYVASKMIFSVEISQKPTKLNKASSYEVAM